MNLLRHSVLSAGLHRITAVIFALSLIFTLSAFASDFYTVDTVPNPRLENTSFHVSDPASLLTHDTVSYLNEKLTQLEKDTGIQSAVVEDAHHNGGYRVEHSPFLSEEYGSADAYSRAY